MHYNIYYSISLLNSIILVFGNGIKISEWNLKYHIGTALFNSIQLVLLC